MSRRLALAGIVSLVVAAAVGVIVVRDRSEDPETALVRRGTIDVTIETVGSLQAPNAAMARAETDGIVARLGVGAGDTVREGDVVALLDRRPFDRAVDEARAELEQAEVALQLAELKSAAAPDDVNLRVEAAAALAVVDQARSALEIAEESLRHVAILAPVDGVVLELLVQAGEPIATQAPVARILAPGQLELVADVDELDLPNVAPGAVARFRLDAYPALEIAGAISATAPQADLESGATIFATTIRFDPPEELDLRPGMNADVTIVTEAREGVLLIPDAALKTVGERVFVTVITDGDREEREVTLGYRGEGEVEVVAGLMEGERVALRR